MELELKNENRSAQVEILDQKGSVYTIRVDQITLANDFKAVYDPLANVPAVTFQVR